MENNQIVYIKSTLENYIGEVSQPEAEALLSYYEMLSEKNKVMNLTRIEGLEDTVVKHFADSLIIEKYVDIKSAKKLLDLGSGAGLPGIPLAIRFPHLKVLSLDSVGKKLNFQKETADALGLKNFAILHARAEDAAHDRKYRESYDLVTARAVANLATLAEYTLPFLKQNGLLVAYKGPAAEEEIQTAKKAVKILGGAIEKVYVYTIDCMEAAANAAAGNSVGQASPLNRRGAVHDQRSARTTRLAQPEAVPMERTLILIRKRKGTPPVYPRRAGIPLKEPLL